MLHTYRTRRKHRSWSILGRHLPRRPLIDDHIRPAVRTVAPLWSHSLRRHPSDRDHDDRNVARGHAAWGRGRGQSLVFGLSAGDRLYLFRLVLDTRGTDAGHADLARCHHPRRRRATGLESLTGTLSRGPGGLAAACSGLPLGAFRYRQPHPPRHRVTHHPGRPSTALELRCSGAAQRCRYP